MQFHGRNVCAVTDRLSRSSFVHVHGISTVKGFQLCCRLVIKLGPQHDMGMLLPIPSQGWRLCITGHDFAVWEKSLMELPSGSASSENGSSNIVTFDSKPQS